MAFVAAVPLGLALIFEAQTSRGRLSAIVFAATVAAMFGASALYHSPNWSEAPKRWLRRVDHAGIYGLIAGTYTAFGLLALSGYWRWVVLSIVWAGALAAIIFKFAWLDAPMWTAGLTLIALPLLILLAIDRYRSLGHSIVDGRVVRRVDVALRLGTEDAREAAGAGRVDLAADRAVLVREERDHRRDEIR